MKDLDRFEDIIIERFSADGRLSFCEKKIIFDQKRIVQRHFMFKLHCSGAASCSS